MFEQAEREYQDALRALHQARGELDEVSAELRRLLYQYRSDPSQVDAQRQALQTRAADLEQQVGKLRAHAAALRADLGRRAQPEPDQVAPSPPSQGFEQPPFSRGW